MLRKKNQGVTTNDKLTAKLIESERCNDELKSEISSLKRIQSEQSRALSKMVHENNYPQKIKALVEELKF